MTIQSFGKYQLVQKLATGGMAEVWLARYAAHDTTDRLMVVKRILPHLVESPEFVQMFLNEARIAARFNHPNIAQVFDLGAHDDSFFIAMEYVHGEDLGRVMHKAWSSRQWISKPLAIRIIASACEGLHYAHTKRDEQGRPLEVVHRDVSPQNILVGYDGQVKLVDFGIAKASGIASLTRTGSLKGKFAYMSPEQAAGKHVDHRGDVFSLALVLYELITGVKPLKRDTELATLHAAVECAIRPPSECAEVGPELDRILMIALAKDPDRRFADAHSFQMALEEVLQKERWPATVPQVAELMAALFPDRVNVHQRLGLPEEVIDELSPILTGALLDDSKASSELDAEWDVETSEGEEFTERSVRGDGQEESMRSWESMPSTEVAPEEPSSGKLSPGVYPAVNPVTDEAGAETRSERAPSRPEARRSSQPGYQYRPITPFSIQYEDLPTDSGSHRVTPAPPPRRSSSGVRTRAQSQGGRLPKSTPKQGGPGLGRRLLGALVLVGAVVVGVRFGEPILGALQRRPIDGKDILLTVETSPGVEVYVRHAKSEGAELELERLGPTPLERAPGAHILDTLVLSNPEIGLHYEEALQFGSPGQEVKLEKVFGKGTLRIVVQPSVNGLTIWRGHQEVGRYTPGAQLELYEGRQKLELRGAELRRSYPFEVEILPGALTEKAIDLSEVIGALPPSTSLGVP